MKICKKKQKMQVLDQAFKHFNQAMAPQMKIPPIFLSMKITVHKMYLNKAEVGAEAIQVMVRKIKDKLKVIWRYKINLYKCKICRH